MEMRPPCIIRRTEANASKSDCFAVTSGCSSKNGTTTDTQVAPSLHGETKQRVAMVVVASVLDDLPAPEHLLEEFERRPRRRRLGDRELVLDLPAEEAPGVAHDEIEKQPSPSTKPTTHCSSPGLSC